MRELRGLRGRLTLALAAASALTVVLVGVLLLAPLDSKLRDDALTSLRQTARATQPSLSRLDATRTAQLRKRILAIRRRTGAEALVVDERIRVLAASDFEPDDRLPQAREALAGNRVVSGITQGEAQVALPFDAGGERLALVLRRPLGQLDGAQDVVQRSLIAAGLVAIAIAAVLGGLLATGMARRLIALRETALRVSGPGKTPDMEPDDTRDEIGDLSRAFATMQLRLGQQESARRTFVSTASHELRTPLSSLRLMLEGAGEVLAEQPPDLAEARDQVARALGQTQRLSKLADELLDLSRIDARLPLREEPVELSALARSIATEFAGAPITWSAPVTWVAADPGSAARVIRILLDNALRHAATAVSIALAVAGEEVILTVTDDGPGVDPADAERIFERFERGSPARDAAGFGLGLAIGRELATRMGGHLRLVPTATGAAFAFALPRAAEAELGPTA